MNETMVRDLLLTIEQLKAKPNVRKGIVSAVSPLAVKLGGSATPYTNVANGCESNLLVGDSVSVLMWGGDMLIIGRLPSYRTVTGAFTGAAAVLIAGTGGWTVARNSVGDYTVTFVPAFASANIVPIATIYQGGAITDVTVIAAGSIRILTFNLAGGAVDTNVLFHAKGV